MRCCRCPLAGSPSALGRAACSTGRTSCGPLLTAATPLGGTFAGFVAIRALLGVGQSADWPSSIVAIRRWFPHSERAKGNSILLGGLYLGPIAAAPITTWVILHFGWRWAFYGFGILGLLIGIAWWFWFRDDPAEHPAITAEEAAHIAAGQHDAADIHSARRFLALPAGLRASGRSACSISSSC